MSRARLPSVIQTILISLLYAAVVHGSMELLPQVGRIVAVWPANGIVLAALLMFPARSWPLLLAGSGAALAGVNLAHGTATTVALALTLGNLVELLVAAGLLRRCGIDGRFTESLRSLWVFLALAVVLSPALSASLIAALLSMLEGSDFSLVWRSWWVADAVGLITVTPLVGAWFARAVPVGATSQRLAEGALLALGLLGTAYVEFNGVDVPAAFEPTLPILTLPFQIWAAVRFGVRGATASNALVVLMAIVAPPATIGFISSGDSPADAILALQVAVGSTAMATLVLAALFDDGRRAEQRAREAEALLRDAIESIGEGFAIFDTQDRLVMCNPQFRALYSQIADLVVPGIAYEQLLRAAARRGQFAGAIDQPDEWVAESLRRHRNPSGEVELQLSDGRWVLVRERRTRDGGTVGLRADVTRLKRQEAALRDSEERYRRLVEATPDAVLVHQNGEIIFANSACLTLFGASRADQVTGKSPMQFLHPDERTATDGQVRLLMTLEKPLALSARKVLRLDGSTADVDINATPMIHEGRSTVLVILRDVTDRKAAEDQLRSAQKMEALGQLTGGVAHDFNNLLMVIIGNLELAAERLGNGTDLKREIGMALAAAERGAGLTHRLLAFARRQLLQPERLDLNALVSELSELLRLTLSEKIEVDIVTQPGLWNVTADHVQVENALVNLTVNARDAMPACGKLTIETANVHLDADYAYRNADVMPGDYVMLEVSDTGTGMPPEIIARAFDPFFTTKDVGKGSGLGLSVIYGFAKQSGGHLKIYSQVGHGTAVRLYMPRAAADESDATLKPAPSAKMPEGAETILVVEDDPSVRNVTVARLLDLGYHVLEAPDGTVARKMLVDGTAIDLLFTDVVMPGAFNGIELAEESRRLVPGLKVLLTSGYPAHAPANLGNVELGSAFLPKPYQKRELARKVREVLDAPTARKAASR